MPKYSCECCGITEFKNKQAYDRHNQSNRHKMSSLSETVKHTCHCGKWFSYRSGLSLHKKKCSVITNAEENSNSNIQERLEAYEKQQQELQAQIEILKKKSTTTTTNTNSHNTTNNNITIQINPFGQEDVDRIGPEYFLYCLNKVYSSSPALAEKIYSYPENQNIRIPNKNKPYASIQNDKGESELKFLDEVLDQMECFCYTLLEEKFTDPEYRRKMSNMKREAFEKYINAYENDDKGTIRKKIRSSLKLMLLNMAEKQK